MGLMIWTFSKTSSFDFLVFYICTRFDCVTDSDNFYLNGHACVNLSVCKIATVCIVLISSQNNTNAVS